MRYRLALLAAENVEDSQPEAVPPCAAMWLLAFGIAVAIIAWLAVLLWSGWIRPLRRLRDQVLALSRGEWNRLLLSEPLPGELWTVLLRLEGLRRALLDRLRSSTELNLQLEGEVARRSTDLARRNAELTDALHKLQRAREELVRSERMAAVGSVVASLTSEINNPIASMVSLVAPLKEAHAELTLSLQTLSDPGASKEAERQRAIMLMDEQREMLALLLRSGRRTRDVVRAMRGYVSTGSQQPSIVPLLPLLGDLYHLFAERLTPRVVSQLGSQPVETALYPLGPASPHLEVVVVRSELSVLLSRWLLRTLPRLGVEHRSLLRIGPGPGHPREPSIELSIEDSGPPLGKAELQDWQEHVATAQLSFAVQAHSQSADCRPDGITTELRITLPLAQTGQLSEPNESLLGDAEEAVYVGEVDIAARHR